MEAYTSRTGVKYYKYKCTICKKQCNNEYMEPTKSEMLSWRICFDCHFWCEKVSLSEHPQSTRIEGVHYWPYPMSEDRHQFLGHGGRLFHIRWNDGRHQVSNNVWCQGVIPNRFRHLLPDNARFMKNSEA